MQEKPSISPSVIHMMPEEPSISPSVTTDYGNAGNERNIITAVCLGLSLPFAAFFILSTGYDDGPFVMWGLISDALKSGILYINDGTPLIAFGYALFGIWSVVSLIFSLNAYRRKQLHAKKSTIMWASILLGVNILLIVFLLVISDPNTCIEQNWNGNGVCGLPVRPGVVVPKPVFPQP